MEKIKFKRNYFDKDGRLLGSKVFEIEENQRQLIIPYIDGSEKTEDKLFTGIKDANNEDIFFGDNVKLKRYQGYAEYHIVMKDSYGIPCFVANNIPEETTFEEFFFKYENTGKDIEIIKSK